MIKLILDGSATTISSSSDSSSTTIKVTTDCLSPSTSVSFTWYYFKEGQTPVLIENSQPLELTDEYGCMNGHCGGNGVVKITSKLTINEDPDGEYYYFKVLVNQTDALKMFNITDRKFKMKVNSENDDNGSSNVASFIAVGVSTFAVTVLLFISSIVVFKCIRFDSVSVIDLH
ncbi:uncharacterized protein LOC132751533 [Ruditapes philippinarum]|uniref:uncharacterized protein LOC132751533 n=1 Tax=Ruditapes philippinarum TaxID=129788 RepID=UPI00295BF165|nr:uncharacterized protein LOC132751533 [Ruditapes philippinarum]